MNIFKKVIIYVLLLALTVSHIPPVVAQASTDTTSDSATTLQGENTIGEILAADINEAQQEQYSPQDGSAILDITIQGQTANVSYSLQQEAVILVSIYSQDGMELVTEGRITCDPGDGVTELTFPDQLPTYFYISAFVLDPQSNKPLCSAYKNPMYTQSMQELLNSTVDDYDPELVLNLDESENTNFLVFSESTKEITQKENTNIVRSADDESRTYIIDNADKQFTGLKSGDIIRYAYGENDMLIVKVASLSISGTTVTLTGQAPEAEEVFQAVKIEGSSQPDEIIFDETSCDDGLTYMGNKPATRASGTEHFPYSHPYKVEKEISKGPVSVSVKGNLDINFDITVNYYLTTFDQYITLKNDVGIKADLTFTGKLEWEPQKLQFNVTFLGVFSAGIELGLSIGAEIEGKFSAAFNQTIAFVYDNGDFSNISTKPVFESNADVSASVKLGVSVGLNLQLLSGLAKVGLSAGLEFSVSAKIEDGPTETNGRMHYCTQCLGISIDFNFKLWIDLGLVWGLIDEDFNLVDEPVHICDFYYSFDLNQGGYGTCPNKMPQLLILSAPFTELEIITDAKTQTAKTNMLGFAVVYVNPGDVRIIATNGDRHGLEDLTVTESTVVQVDLSYQGYIGDIYWHLSTSGTLSLTGTGSSVLPTFPEGEAPWDNLPICVEYVSINHCIVADNAFAGQSNIYNVSLRNCTVGAKAFKNCSGITLLYLYENVTVGDSAFENCTKLLNISFPTAGTCTIGQRAFANCIGMDDLSISCPDLAVGKDAFLGCTSLRAIYTKYLDAWLNISFANETANPLYYAGKLYVRNALLTTLEIDGSVGDYAFAGCTILLRAEFSEDLTAIGAGAFTNCTALADIYFYGNPPSIADNAFTGVTATAYHIDYNETWQDTHRISYGGDLTWDVFLRAVASGAINTTTSWILREDGSLTIYGSGKMESYSSSKDAPWSKYCDQITTVTISEGITYIGYNAFVSLPNLQTVSFPSTITKVGAPAFEACPALTEVHIPDIASWAKIVFGSKTATPLQNPSAQLCVNGTVLKNVTIPGTVETIGPYSFYNFRATTITIEEGVTTVDRGAFYSATINRLYLPESLKTIEYEAFYGASLPLEITFPEHLESIGSKAFYQTNISKVIFTGKTTIQSSAFAHSDITEVDLGPVSYIGSSAFQSTELSKVDISGQNVQIGNYAFESCFSLVEVTCSGTIASIGRYVFEQTSGGWDKAALKSIEICGNGNCEIDTYAFYFCTNLESIYMNGVSYVDRSAFYCNDNHKISADVYIQDISQWLTLDFGFANPLGGTLYVNNEPVTHLRIPEGVTTINNRAFSGCTSITSIEFPSSLATIGNSAFLLCDNLSEIRFLGSAPTIQENAFYGVSATVYYPGDDSWTDDVKAAMGGNLTWVISGGSSSGGSSSQEVQVRTEQFTELIPGQEYLYISVIDPEAPDLLEYNNLLYINQYVADENGVVVCSYHAYADTVTGHGLIFGGGKLRICDAQVTFPEMTISSEPILVTPTVILGEQTLTEGKDYTLTGDLVYSKVGYYTCTIRGINEYCDSIACTYAVKHPALELVTTDGVNACFENLNTAISACDTTAFVRLTADHAEDITIAADAQLDLNGCTLTGDVTVSNGATLYVFDSATADFTADHRGMLLGTVTGNLARTALTPVDAYGASYKYLTLQEDENTYSFHRIYLSVHSAVLTPYRDYGDYIGTDLNYKAAFKCNDLVAQYVTAYGADISLSKTVSLDFLSRPIVPGADSMNERKTTLRDTLRSTNLSFQNADNAAQKPLVQLYIRLNDGLQEQVNARPVEVSLREMVAQLCKSTDYTVAQKTALANMYNTHKNLMDSWNESVDTLQLFAQYFGFNASVTWISPLSSCTLTSPFGYRVHPVTGVTSLHNGIDLSAGAGTPIYAVRSGTVTKAAFDSSSGYYVSIDHGDGFSTRYQHMTHYIVAPGQYVEQGQIIGYVGSTGTSSGPHLHLCLQYNGQYINPLYYIKLN